MLPNIPFNKPFIAGRELEYIAEAVENGHIAADGKFTRQCSAFLEERFGFEKVLMTPSCTAALELAAMLCELGPGDEVIMPSFTFVSTANAVVRTGATPCFVDIREDTLNLNEQLIEAAISQRTKAIMPVHYAGVSCEMDEINRIAAKHGLYVIEDAAQSLNSTYQGKALGGLGHFAGFSFHETKNFVCGEGGALCVNDAKFIERAEILRDKGTNRKQFFRGEVDKYTWVDVGSSYVPSELACAFLFGQFEFLEKISERRQEIYREYMRRLEPLEKEGLLKLPRIPDHCGSNSHLFYILLPARAARDELLNYLRTESIHAVFHYIPLHSSPMGRKLGRSDERLNVTDGISGRLLRLPFFFDLDQLQQTRIVNAIATFLR